MNEIKLGAVVRVREARDGCQTLEVEVAGSIEPALCFPQLTGEATVGDRVSLNTAAITLGLGTGGYHIVLAVYGREQDLSGQGHIFKLRYTPVQAPVLAVEAPESPHHERLREAVELDGAPVLVAGLHSAAAVAGVALRRGLGHSARLVYIMTDGAALPAAMSRLLAKMRSSGWFDSVITAGHAFGGDHEAVGVPSALVAARTALGADAIVVGMGPGVVGTGTRLGTTALEQGPILDAAAALGGENLAIARVGFADARARHHGLSHHTLTALNLFAQRPAQVVLPALADPDLNATLRAQAKSLAPRHRLAWQPAEEIGRWLAESGLNITTMGRNHKQDPAFFAAAAAPALWLAARR